MAGILVRKLEMTRIVKENSLVPVTLLKVPVLKIVQVKSIETDGYDALVIGVLDSESSELKEGKKALSLNDFSITREVPVNSEDLRKYSAGDDLTLDCLDGITEVEIVSYSKGKGFTGAMKRYNFSGGPKTHGSKFHRALGSIGNRKPTRTHRGKKMHGHHGNFKITLKNVGVELINKDLGVVAVKGPVPGSRNSYVVVKF